MDVSQINTAIISNNYTADQLTSIIDAVTFARSRKAAQNRRSVIPGTTVAFRDPRSGVRHEGTVIRIKVKNVEVSCKTYGRGGVVNVPSSLLEVV
jgi:hypothetical protein